ncbi:type I restriction-modification system subunit M [Campylobacter cuniculorum]|uniref:type I restriction-modification system subunit M n=1 Tax=Campylobacter cuniculorum TaxID=374106 RepID=UPI0023F1AF30|nr:type I restriction-modification system subunit M [Campylobacter cuniculorum]
MNKTSQQTINDICWKACNVLRGSIDPNDYKDYILTLLFIKYLSDFHKEKVEELNAQYEGNQEKREERVKDLLQHQAFKLDESCDFDALVKKKEQDKLGDIMNAMLERIEKLNAQKLQGIFNVDFNELGDNTSTRNALLRKLIETFDDKRLDLRPKMLENNDVLGDAYEYLIANFASTAGKKGGEFYTPKEVSALLSQLVFAEQKDTKEGVSIYDPTCGSGSLLIKASKEASKHNKAFRLYGQESNPQTHALCRMNMVLHNINDADIQRGDTLRDPKHIENNQLRTFDIVLANPPFSLSQWGEEQGDPYHRFAFGIPPKNKGDYAFILHMLSSLNAQGTLGVILPHGVLFRGGSEGKIRTKLIESNLIHAIIGLPANLFYGTGIPACILIFKKHKQDKNVLFIDASKEFEKGKNQNALKQEHINKIIQTYKDRKSVEKYAHLASYEEIKENDYNLNIARYVDSFEEDEEIDLQALKTEIAELEKECQHHSAKLKAYLKELGL